MGGNTLKPPRKHFFVVWHNPETNERGWKFFDDMVEAFRFHREEFHSPMIRSVWWGYSSATICRYEDIQLEFDLK